MKQAWAIQQDFVSKGVCVVRMNEQLGYTPAIPAPRRHREEVRRVTHIPITSGG